jgi:hypothetical protein
VLRAVKPVDPKLLIEANEALTARQGKGDPALTLVAHFNNRLDPDELVAIDYRLMALANLIKAGEGSAWVSHSKGERYKLVDETMFRAAAITPLSIEDHLTVSSLSFDTDTFLKHALSEATTYGTA